MVPERAQAQEQSQAKIREAPYDRAVQEKRSERKPQVLSEAPNPGSRRGRSEHGSFQSLTLRAPAVEARPEPERALASEREKKAWLDQEELEQRVELQILVAATSRQIEKHF